MSNAAHDEADQLFRPPWPSLRSRRWNRKTEFACRESYVSPDDREIHCESGMEGKALLAILADPRVRDVVEQPPPVTYLDDDGVRRSHTVDLLAMMRDGTRTAFLVKPRWKAEKISLSRTRDLLAAQVPRSFADRWKLLHEDQLTRVVVDRGQMILRVRLHGPFSDDPSVARMAAIVDGPMRAGDAVKVAAGTADFWSLVRLVADGRLRTLGGARLAIDSVLAPLEP